MSEPPFHPVPALRRVDLFSVVLVLRLALRRPAAAISSYSSLKYWREYRSVRTFLSLKNIKERSLMFI